MSTLKRALIFSAMCPVVVGLLTVELGSRTLTAGGQGAGAASQASASRAARLQKERDNVELQKVPPFKVFDNLYYVGVGWVSSWLVTTNQGLILIDTLEELYVDRLLDNIRTVGFDPLDIKYVLVTHAHFDHIGGAARIQDTYGAKVAMMDGDWKLLVAPEVFRAWIQELKAMGVKRLEDETAKAASLTRYF